MIYRLGEICDIFDGPHATPPETDSGPIFLGIKNINENCELDISEVKYISESNYQTWTRRVCPQEDDIVFSYEATLNRYALIPYGFYGCLGRRLGIARVKNTSIVNPHFLYHYFCSSTWKSFIEANKVVGSTVLRVSIEEFPDYTIELPSIQRQNSIANLLDNIVEKKKNNDTICSNLEAMAKLLYDYWFVQFDFPDENGKPYKSSGGKMVWNEELKREIPEGWEVKNLGNLCSFMNGINYNKDEIGDKTYRIVNVRNITASTLVLDDSDFDEITLRSVQAERYIVKENDILIARSGVPGATRLLLNIDNKTIFCGFIIRCEPNDSSLRFYLTYLLKQLEGTSATQTGGSILQNVSQDTLSRVSVIVPPSRIIELYNKWISEYLNMIQNYITENKELVSLRDFLLPMLMNGQVRLSDRLSI